MKCPVFILDLTEALFELALHQDVLFLVIGFSRGAMWSAWLARMFPQRFDGVMLVGLYPMDESAMAQEALDLLRAVPRVAVLHGLKDDHSTILEHEPFWRIILGAEEGDDIENCTPHFKTWVCMANHDNSRNSIVADFPPECQLLRRALWDHMVLPGDRRLAYRDLPSQAWD